MDSKDLKTVKSALQSIKNVEEFCLHIVNNQLTETEFFEKLNLLMLPTGLYLAVIELFKSTIEKPK